MTDQVAGTARGAWLSRKVIVATGDQLPMCHAVSMVELTSGLMAVWYAGSYEGARDTVLFRSRLSADGVWTQPDVLLDLPGLPVGNPVLFTKDGTLWLFFVILFGEWWTEARIAAITSSDEGVTWSNPRIIWDEQGFMTKTTPISVGGRMILPVYDERSWCSMVLISRDDGVSWQLFGDSMGRGVTIQPKIIELADGRLLMYSRSTRGAVYYSLSYNGGLSWIASQPTDIPNPNSGLDLVRLRSGSLLLACNDGERGRSRLSLLLSQDEGKTWPVRQVLEDSEGEFSYPVILEGQDGDIHVAYTSQRSKIVHVHIDQRWSEGAAAQTRGT